MAEKVDAVIVGSGAAGAIVAKQLAEAGLRIVVLEKGREWTRKDVVHDELRGDQRQTRFPASEYQANTESQWCGARHGSDRELED